MAILLSAMPGCEPRPAAKSIAAEPAILFDDARASSGIDFRLGHDPGRPPGILETNGHPAAFLDADGDGRLDVLLAGPGRVVLYRNLGGWKFAPVPNAGLSQPGHWQGVAVADVDSDGRPDLYLAGFGCAGLYLNRGGGRFRDATPGSELDRALSGRWQTSAAFADVNGDGRPDLYVGAYLSLGGRDGVCEPAPGVRTACGPLDFPAQKGRFFLNLGRGRFRDATRDYGLEASHGRTLGVSFCDVNGDRRPDLYLANDKMPADLFLNANGRRFRELATEAGVAMGPDGTAQAGMGVDWGDDNGDGLPDLVVTTYEREPTALYRGEGAGLFADASYSSGVGPPTMPFVGYGVKWADLDNDGNLDLTIANGHPLHRAREIDPATEYAQPFQVLRNTGSGHYEALPDCGAGLPRALVGRALCTGDLDNDGRVDLLISDIEGQPLLLRNVSPPGGHWLTVRLKSSRALWGALVIARSGGRQWVRRCDPGGSYLSSSDPRVHIGLGRVRTLDSLEVRWPWGGSTLSRDVAADRVLDLAAPGAGS